MSFKKEIKQSLEQIQQMQELYRQVRDLEILPISFFSTAYDVLKNLTVALHEMEATQAATMREHLLRHESGIIEAGLLLKKSDKNSDSEEFVKLDSTIGEGIRTEGSTEDTLTEKESSFKKEKPENHFHAEFLGDLISKRLVVDLRKALSLNDRFRFQKDLFDGDSNLMNSTLVRLNEFNSFDEAMKFLDAQFRWNWENGSATEFREILEKRFS